MKYKDYQTEFSNSTTQSNDRYVIYSSKEILRDSHGAYLVFDKPSDALSHIQVCCGNSPGLQIRKLQRVYR